MSTGACLLYLFLIIATYGVFVWMMMKEWINVMWSLIFMSTLVLVYALIFSPGSVTWEDFTNLFLNGPTNQFSMIMTFYVVSLFAAVLGATGVTQLIIKKAAELGGDKRLLVVILCCLATEYVAWGASTGGGQVCLVIGIPIFLSLGVPPLWTAIYLSTASMLNANWWAHYIALNNSSTGMVLADCLPYLATYTVIYTLIFIVALVLWERRLGKVSQWAAPTDFDSGDIALDIKPPKSFTMILPLLPILFLVFTKLSNFMVFFICTVAVMLCTAPGTGRTAKGWGRTFNNVTLDAMELLKFLLPTFVGVGFINVAAKTPGVNAILAVAFKAILPTNAILVFFFFMIYLCVGGVFRGPAVMFSMGAAIMAVICSLNIYPVVFVSALMMACNNFTDIADTTTGPLSLANSMTKTSIIAHMKRSYLLGVALGASGIILALIMYF